jgi:hypothetical protein
MDAETRLPRHATSALVLPAVVKQQASVGSLVVTGAPAVQDAEARERPQEGSRS